MAELDHNVKNALPKCPKGLKIHAYIKGQAALMGGKTKAEQRYFMRTMGIAAHEAAMKVKRSASQSQASKGTHSAAIPDVE